MGGAENLTFICKLVSGMNAFIAFNFVLVVSTFLTGYPQARLWHHRDYQDMKYQFQGQYDSITNPFIP